MARITARRPEAVLLVLLSACLIFLSIQVRRPGGATAGERWLLELASPFVAAAARGRAALGELLEWGSTHARLVRENRELRSRIVDLQTETLRLRDAER